MTIWFYCSYTRRFRICSAQNDHMVLLFLSQCSARNDNKDIVRFSRMGFHANACAFALNDVLMDKKSKLRPRVVAVDGVLLIQLIAPIALYADCALCRLRFMENVR